MISSIEHQHFQRLKVNRVAVAQELKVEHVLHSLKSSSVLDNDDINFIHAGQSKSDKAKRLLDVLPTKGRYSNWYRHFRAALLNPLVDDTNVKRKYQSLVDFLDNTIISQMCHFLRPNQKTSEARWTIAKYRALPKISVKDNLHSKMAERKSSQITSINSNDKPSGLTRDHKTIWSIKELEDTMIPYSELHWQEMPQGFTPHFSQFPVHIAELEMSPHNVDKKLAIYEREAYEKITQLDILYFMWQEQKVPDDTVLCTCSSVLEIIQHPDLHNLYFKYFETLLKEYKIDVLTNVANSYDEVSQWLAADANVPTIHQLVLLGSNLIEFLSEFGSVDLAKQVHSSMLTYLVNMDSMESWLPLFHVYIKGMKLSNQVCDYNEADRHFRQAFSMKEQINLVSFGQNIIDCSQLFIETSVMMRELGSLGPSYTWAQKTMQEVDIYDPSTVIRTLCNASVAYSNQWKVLRAEDLAVEAVQQAKTSYGVYHPIYLSALQNFVTFSNQFRRDEFGVDAAAAAVNISNKIYGIDCMQSALAFAGHANALMSVGRYNGGLYYKLAERAYNIAVDKQPLYHPNLIPYIETLVQSILCRASVSADEKEKHELINWAEGETKSLIRICEKHFGEKTYKTATAQLLYSDVSLAAGRLNNARDCLESSLKALLLCLGENHGDVHYTKVKLAEILMNCGELRKVESLLVHTVEFFDTGAYFMPWYSKACLLLTNCYEKLGKLDLVKEYRSKYLGWKWTIEDHSRRITWRELHANPEGYDNFLEKLELWRLNVKKVQDNMEKLKLSSRLI